MPRSGDRRVSDFRRRAPCVSTTPLSPGHRNEFHAGLRAGVWQVSRDRCANTSGSTLTRLSTSAWSATRRSPIRSSGQSSKIPGYAIRATVPNFHGLTAFMVTSSVAARFFGPQIAGIGATPGAISVFRIDHDEIFNATTHLQYQLLRRRLRGSASTGVTIAVWWPARCPAREANCANGPNGTDSVVDVSGLTPDQQFQGGLFCGTVHATPTTPISPTGLCPANLYGSTLVSDSRARHGRRRPQPAPHRAAQSFRHRA